MTCIRLNRKNVLYQRRKESFVVVVVMVMESGKNNIVNKSEHFWSEDETIRLQIMKESNIDGGKHRNSNRLGR